MLDTVLAYALRWFDYIFFDHDGRRSGRRNGYRRRDRIARIRWNGLQRPARDHVSIRRSRDRRRDRLIGDFLSHAGLRMHRR
jgi:hypothetical protein